MRRRPTARVFPQAVVLAAVVLWCAPAEAQHSISRSTFASSAGIIGGGGTKVLGTVGEPAAGFSSGGTSAVGSGVWRLPRTLAAPALVAFAGGTAPFQPALDWSDAFGAASYELVYVDNISFVGATVVSGLGTSSFTFPGPLADGTYFWHVRAIGPSTSSATSATDSFAVIPTFGQWTAILVALCMVSYLVRRKLVLARPVA